MDGLATVGAGEDPGAPTYKQGGFIHRIYIAISRQHDRLNYGTCLYWVVNRTFNNGSIE
jgi:phosphatidylethanolamine-binding protein (PEBP) family uncharacterized protein